MFNAAIRFTGTPGVGKSYFLFFVLYKLLQLQKTVFVTLGKRMYLFKFEDGDIVVDEDVQPIIHLCDPSKILILINVSS